MNRSSSFDDASLSLPVQFVPQRDIPVVDEPIKPYTGSGIYIAPPTAPVEECRGRSRSRSPRRSIDLDVMYPICGFARNQMRQMRRYTPSRSPSRSRSHSRNRRCSRSRSRSSTPSWTRCPRRRSRSPGYLYTGTSRPRPSRTPSPPLIVPPPPHPPVVVMPPPPPVPCPMSPPSPSPWYVPPPNIWPTQVPKQPVDILTFHYNKNMAYAPAAKTYDEAIDMVVELWPELREVERDRISLLVTGSDHLVRVPRMTWTAVLCDLPRYEVVHVQVEEVPPPPQYQGKGKGKWRDNDEKGHRSSGLFSSIRRIFGGK